jgi:RNA polymerase sigma factor (sigma-70 family)
MARVGLSAVQHEFRALFDEGTNSGLTDGELLDRFLARDREMAEAAFAALVARHGPMVMGVCRRILRDPHHAADAFQATFLVLVCKAAGLRIEGSLGRWLHGVSRRIALQARKAAARRAAHEQHGTEWIAAPGADPESGERLLLLDEELACLPARYREAIVLCDLEGLTHDAAARQLGCPTGTIESRLWRGRRRLRARLTSRGLAPQSGVFLLALRGAALPPELAREVVRSAVNVAAGISLGGAVSAPVATLSLGFLGVLRIAQITAAVLSLAFIGTCASIVAHGNRAGAGEASGRGAVVGKRPAIQPPAADGLVLVGRTDYDPDSLVKIRPRFDTLVEKVHVELGQTVKQGDPLVDLFSTDLAQAKTHLQTAYKQWQHDLDLCVRREILLKSKAISAQLLNDSQIDESKSRLAFLTAKEKLIVFGVSEMEISALLAEPPTNRNGKEDEKARAKPRNTRRAPITGVVIQRDVVPGNLYDVNDVLLIVAPADHLFIWADLAAQDRHRVKEGQNCAVEIPFLPSTIRAKVEYISETKTRDGAMKIRFRVPNTDGRIKADTRVRVKILERGSARKP